jgi:hypothetical protein
MKVEGSRKELFALGTTEPEKIPLQRWNTEAWCLLTLFLIGHADDVEPVTSAVVQVPPYPSYARDSLYTRSNCNGPKDRGKSEIFAHEKEKSDVMDELKRSAKSETAGR